MTGGAIGTIAPVWVRGPARQRGRRRPRPGLHCRRSRRGRSGAPASDRDSAGAGPRRLHDPVVQGVVRAAPAVEGGAPGRGVSDLRGERDEFVDQEDPCPNDECMIDEGDIEMSPKEAGAKGTPFRNEAAQPKDFDFE